MSVPGTAQRRRRTKGGMLPLAHMRLSLSSSPFLHTPLPTAPASRSSCQDWKVRSACKARASCSCVSAGRRMANADPMLGPDIVWGGHLHVLLLPQNLRAQYAPSVPDGASQLRHREPRRYAQKSNTGNHLLWRACTRNAVACTASAVLGWAPEPLRYPTHSLRAQTHQLPHEALPRPPRPPTILRAQPSVPGME